MTIDLTDTTTGGIHDALRQARLRLGGVASGMVLTLPAARAAVPAGRRDPGGRDQLR